MSRSSEQLSVGPAAVTAAALKQVSRIKHTFLIIEILLTFPPHIFLVRFVKIKRTRNGQKKKEGLAKLLYRTCFKILFWASAKAPAVERSKRG